MNDTMINFKLAYHFFSLNQMIRLTSQKLVLPFYHTICDQQLPHISHLYQLRTKKQFENDLDYLCKYFQPVSLQELNNIITGNQTINKPIFHLTFDDGLRESYTDIAPILERKGIPATFFINTNFIDNKALFYRYKVSLLIEKITTHTASATELSKHFGKSGHDLNEMKARLLSFNYNDLTSIDDIARLLAMDFKDYLTTRQPYLSKDQTKNLIERGFSIGSHSLDHPYFKDIDEDEKMRQIIESFHYLHKELGIDAYYFSFPFSDASVTSSFFNWLHNDADCRLSFGISGIKQDFTKYHLHRIPFEQESKNVKNILKGEYLYYIAKSLFNRNRIYRQ